MRERRLGSGCAKGARQIGWGISSSQFQALDRLDPDGWSSAIRSEGNQSEAAFRWRAERILLNV